MKPPKLMVIGWDSVSLTLLDNFKENTPNLRRLMRNGAAGHAIPEFPMYTPTNWAYAGHIACCSGSPHAIKGSPRAAVSTIVRRPRLSTRTLLRVLAPLSSNGGGEAELHPGRRPTRRAVVVTIRP